MRPQDPVPDREEQDGEDQDLPDHHVVLRRVTQAKPGDLSRHQEDDADSHFVHVEGPEGERN